MKASSFLFILACALTGCEPLCSEKVREEVPSPGGEYVAVLFERDCGATTGFVSHVNIRSQLQKFSVTEAGTITDGEIFTADGHPGIELFWKDNSHLQIVCLECSTEMIYKQETTWEHIRISYRNRK